MQTVAETVDNDHQISWIPILAYLMTFATVINVLLAIIIDTFVNLCCCLEEDVKQTKLIKNPKQMFLMKVIEISLYKPKNTILNVLLYYAFCFS